MVKVCICNGAPTAGKTTFQEICRKKCNGFETVRGYHPDTRLWISTMSTVDFVKEIATKCGWNGEKTPKNRKFLSDLKDLLTEWDDVPFKKIVDYIDYVDSTGLDDWLVFVDCREPDEIQKLKERLNATTLLIRRESVENYESSNHADANVFNYEYDLTIWNNSDIINLEKEADLFIKYMRGAPHYVH